MKIALLGDIALFGKFDILSNRNIDTNIADIAEYLHNFDYVIGNLETPFSVKKKEFSVKSAYIYSNPENVKLLKQLNIYAVNIANNHIFDYGEEGYKTTIETLEANDIKYFGNEGRNLIIENNGNKILFNGFCCYSSNPLCLSKKIGDKGINPLNVELLIDILKQNSNKGYLNIFSVHAGIEHINFPAIDNIKLSRKLANIFPYIYYGHHPHVIQGYEMYKGSLIAHSLGNFCFDNIYKNNNLLVELSDNNRKGLILEIEIENNKIISYKTTCIYISKAGKIEIINNENINNYNQELKYALDNIDIYTKKRKDLLTQWVQTRKKYRDFSWVMSKLSLSTFYYIYKWKTNTVKYKNNISNYL